ncbi:MAG: STAS domain-containing protein [Chitinispirillaceae bacterium]|nr:STAS domain-containing protein [Chitinispirillaceae bacterium]
MEIYSFTAHKEFTVLKLRGDIKIAELPALSPALNEHTAKNPNQHIVLDLAEVTAIDRSICILLSNIQKRLHAGGKKLSMLHATPRIAAMLNTAGISDAIEDIYTLECDLNEELFKTYSLYSYQEHDVQRLQCSCVVCGTNNVTGYLLNPNNFTWSWVEDELFPVCTTVSGEEFDFFATLPVICLDCHTVSTDLRHFNLTDKNGTVMLHSTLSESAKLHLTKNIKKRKKIIDGCAEANGDLFLYPRSRNAAYYLYLLADSSIRTLALNKKEADPFLVGLMNYLAIRYADHEYKEELIDNCRTWLTQARNEKKIRSHGEEAQALFILFAAALSLQKIKEANTLMQEFSSMMETISYSKTAEHSISSPLFWYHQMKVLWQKEIAKKSTSFSRHYTP